MPKRSQVTLYQSGVQRGPLPEREWGGCPQPQNEEFLDLSGRIQERPSVVVHTSNSSAGEVEIKQFGSSLTTYSVGVNLDYV